MLQWLSILYQFAVTRSSQADASWFENAAAAQIQAEQLRTAELCNGRAAMLGFVIGLATEALTGQGILHQIGLGSLLSQG